MVLVQNPKKSPTLHHKKRHGHHHKQGKDYSKPYWPYLPLLLVVGLGLLANSLWSQHQAVLGAQSNITANTLLTETNKERSSADEPDLSLNASLSRAAQAKAHDMAAKNYWSHDRPDGKTPWNFIEENGYTYATAGENLAYGFVSSGQAIDGWMNSVEHRTNLLSDSFTQVGFGIATAPKFQGHESQTIVVALYAQPAGAHSNAAVLGAHTFAHAGHSVSRVQLLTGWSWSLLLVSFLAGASISLFIIRHGVFWHRVLVKSEAFVLRHRALDFALAIVAVSAVLLSRSIGFIQ